MLTVKECGERLGLSRSLVYEEIRRGRLPHHVFGKRAIRVSVCDLEGYIDENRMHSDSTPISKDKRNTKSRTGTFKHVSVDRLLS